MRFLCESRGGYFIDAATIDVIADGKATEGPVFAAGGNVIVEPLNASYGYDLAFLWPASHEYLMARGDAWVGVTIRPSSIQSPKKFDAQRYASLSMANPLPASATCANPAHNRPPANEPGPFVPLQP